MDSWIRAAQARAELATPGPWEVVVALRPWSEFAHYSVQRGDGSASWPVRFVAWINGGRDIAANRWNALSANLRDKLIDEGVRPDRIAKPDAAFIAAARSDVPRLCTALLEAVEILECVAGNECRREIGGLMSCEEFFDPNPPLSRPWSDACLPCRARRVLTRIQADPEVEHG